MQGVGSQLRAGAKLTPARLALLLSAPTAVALGCWIYLGLMISDMSAIPGMAAMMMYPRAITPMILLGLILMWAIMMAAMMLPTAAPMILAYVTQRRDRRAMLKFLW